MTKSMTPFTLENNLNHIWWA